MTVISRLQIEQSGANPVVKLKTSAHEADTLPEIEVEESGRGLLIIDDEGETVSQPRPRSGNVVPLRGKLSQDVSAAVDLGARLRGAREARGLSVADVSEVLKFRSDYVEKLEEGEIRELPVTYAVGFLRSYAEFIGGSALGLDVRDAVARVRQEWQEGPIQRGGRWGLSDDSAVPKISLLIVAAMLAVGVCVAWELWQDPSFGKPSEIPSTYQSQLLVITHDR